MQLKKLMAQAFLLANKEYELCQPKWLNELDQALPQGKERERYLPLAENEIFRGQAIMPGHPVYKVLKQEKVTIKNAL